MITEKQLDVIPTFGALEAPSNINAAMVSPLQSRFWLKVFAAHYAVISKLSTSSSNTQIISVISRWTFDTLVETACNTKSNCMLKQLLLELSSRTVTEMGDHHLHVMLHSSFGYFDRAELDVASQLGCRLLRAETTRTTEYQQYANNFTYNVHTSIYR